MRISWTVAAVVGALCLGFWAGRASMPEAPNYEPIERANPANLAASPAEPIVSPSAGDAGSRGDSSAANRQTPANSNDRSDEGRDVIAEAAAPVILRLIDGGGEEHLVVAAPIARLREDVTDYLIPMAAFRGMTDAFLGRDGNGATLRVEARSRELGLIMLSNPTDPAVRRKRFTIRRGKSIVDRVYALDAEGRRIVGADVTGSDFDAAVGAPIWQLSNRPCGVSGGPLVDGNGRLAAIVAPSWVGSVAMGALPIDRDVLARAEHLDLDVAAFRRMDYEGTPDALLAEALRALNEQRFDAAVQAFRELARADANLVAERHDAFAAAHRGRIDSAPLATEPRRRLDLVREAVADLPRDAEFRLELASAARARREFAEAFEAAESAWRLDPNVIGDLGLLLGSIGLDWTRHLIDAGRLDEALAVIARCLERGARSGELLALEGRLRLRRRDYGGASAAFRDALALSPALADELIPLIERADRFTEGPGRVVIDYEPGARAIVTRVTINGRATGDFIVDTGATSTMIPEGLAKSAGLDTSARVPRVRVKTAGNERTLPFSPSDAVTVGGLSVQGLSLIVGDLPGLDQKGLLGMDFLGAFGLENDAENGRLVLYERR